MYLKASRYKILAIVDRMIQAIPAMKYMLRMICFRMTMAGQKCTFPLYPIVAISILGNFPADARAVLVKTYNTKS